MLSLYVLAALWILVLSWWDLRKGSVPHLLTTYPLVALGAFAVLRTAVGLIQEGMAWASDHAIVPVLAVGFAGVLASDWPAVAVLLMLAAVGFAASVGDVGAQTLAVAWLVVTVAFVLGVIRGGDAKVLMLLFALFPSLQFAVWLVGVLLIGGLQFLVERYGNVAPLLVGSALASLMRMRGAEGESAPMLQWVAVAVVTYVGHLFLCSGVVAWA